MVLNYGQVFCLRLLGYEFPLQYQNLWQKTTLKTFWTTWVIFRMWRLKPTIRVIEQTIGFEAMSYQHIERLCSLQIFGFRK